MAVTVMPVPLEAGNAACASPEYLPLVDAAHARPGGPEAQEMKARLCRRCPVQEQCLEWAMTHPEIGIWGGVSPRTRGDHGAPRKLEMVPDYLHRGGAEGVPLERWRRRKADRPPGPPLRISSPPKPATAVARLAELGVRGSEVKHWARDQGLVDTVRGQVSLAVIDAYAAAHQVA